MRRADSKYALQGSYTVEASLIFQVVLLILIYVLLTSEFLTDSVRMTAVMAEQAQVLAGGGRAEESDVNTGGFFRLHSGKIRIDENDRNVTVSCRDVPSPAFFGESYDAGICVRKRKPVSWIWKVRVLKELAG